MISSYLSIGLPPSNYAATWEASSSKQNSRAQPPHDHTPPPPPAATSPYTPAPISWGSLPPMSSPQSHLHAASNPCTLPSLQRRTCSDAAASPKRPTRTQSRGRGSDIPMLRRQTSGSNTLLRRSFTPLVSSPARSPRSGASGHSPIAHPLPVVLALAGAFALTGSCPRRSSW